MEKVKNNYEGIVIISTKNDDETIKGLITKFKDLIEANGTLNKIDEWGKRTLSYLINKDEKEGYYVLYDFTSNTDFPAEFERILKITDGILRYLVIKKES